MTCIGLSFSAASAELACEEVFESGRVKKAKVLINKDARKITLTTSSAFECYISNISEDMYYSRCPNRFVPEMRGQEEMTVTINRKTLDTDFRFGLSEGQTYNFKCKVSEAKI